jgi:hypothetical protein
MKFILQLLALLVGLHAQAQQFSGAFDINAKLFIPNEGQVKDQRGHINRDVKYLYNDGLFNLELKAGGFSYEIFDVVNEDNGFSESGEVAEPQFPQSVAGKKLQLRSHRVDVIFLNANHRVRVEAAASVESYFNFYHAPVNAKQYLHLKSFQKVIYHDLYPGIDLVFYAPDREEETALKYEFIVHPNADPSQIQFEYRGANQISLDEKGACVVNTAYGFIRESKPVCYEGDLMQPVESNFSINHSIKTFSISSYDKNDFLIIDPNIVWGTYYGGELGDEVSELALDSKNKSVIAGNTLSTTHIATSGAFQQHYKGGIYDYFIAKFRTDGKIEWGTYFGGNGKDYAYGVSCDPSENIIVVGNSTSDGLATPGAFQTTVLGNADIVIAKFTTTGLLSWSTYMGGANPENARTAVCDAQGNIYCAGPTSSAIGIATPGAYQSQLAGTFDDTWIAKFSPSGNRIWSTYYGGEKNDRAHAINLDVSGNLYVTGTAESLTGVATAGSFLPAYAGGETDAYLAKFDTSGHMIWATYYGGSWADRARGVQTDSQGYVYLSGFTESDTGIATPGSFQQSWSAGYEAPGDRAEDAFIVKFSSDGQRKWGTYYGGDKAEELWGMTLDRKMKVIYIVGSTKSNGKIAYGIPLQAVKGGGEDGFIAKFYLDGNIEWGSYWGGPASEQFEDIEADEGGYIYLTGRPTTNADPVTQFTNQANFGGGVSDAFVYKFYAGLDCSDSYEPNETIASAHFLTASFAVDSTIFGFNGRIVNATDDDWFKIKVKAAGGNLEMILDDLPENYDLKLFNKNGVLKASSENSGITSDTIIANGLSGGNYYLLIDHDVAEFDSLHCYHLRVLKSEQPFSGKASVIIEDTVTASLIQIYPNPASGHLYLTFNSMEDGNAAIIIYDAIGRVASKKELMLNAGPQKVKIDLDALPSGVYHISMQQKKHFWNGKFMKQ